jgi:ABC-type transporter Mla subunit MlaD
LLLFVQLNASRDKITQQTLQLKRLQEINNTQANQLKESITREETLKQQLNDIQTKIRQVGEKI